MEKNMEGKELKHSFHNHMLTLKAEQSKINGGDDHPEADINCNGCSMLISGPFYSCGECQYFLHKVCAELPSELDCTLHPEHPLALLECSPYRNNVYGCDSCGENGSQFVYNCSECEFDLDMACASATHTIKDKCHPHPLTPLQVPIAFVCHICRKKDKGLSYKCYSCPFWVHQNCTVQADTVDHSHRDHPYPLIKLQHFSHNHPLTLLANELKTEDGIDHLNAKIKCNGCRTEILGPFYCCGECRYFLHKVCAELPSALDHPLHPQHPLTLLKHDEFQVECSLCREIIEDGVICYICSVCLLYVDMKCASPTHKIKDKCHPHPLTPLQVPIAFVCHICRKKDKGLSYKCYSCPFWVHQNCTLLADTVDHSHHEDPYPFIELKHFFHDHPLTLIANERQTEDAKVKIECYGCRTQILGPFYSCGDCRYFLHKVCAELPSALDHPLHSHPLTLLPHFRDDFECSLCRETRFGIMGYTCSECEFRVDMKCASATHVILDKCHPHPLTPSQDPIAFPCHICLVEEKSPSYRCNICPFRVHQNCTLIPNTAKHSYHDHLLKLLPSIPFEFRKVSKLCDICHSKLFMFQCVYGCVRCLAFSHVSCARSETIESRSTSRDQNTDGQSQILLPVKQDSTDFISRFVRNYIDEDANKDNKIDHFGHEHPLSLIDEERTDKTCEACAIRILAPSYGCIDCDYFLHKCCTDLPKQIRHPLRSEEQLILQSAQDIMCCSCCEQYCNSFFYKCLKSEDFRIDIKCASILQGVVYHEAHKHPLLPTIIKSSSIVCTACGLVPEIILTQYYLQCNTCSFVLCFICAMAPRVIKHRYGKSEPFKLTYYPFENHDDEYICELCMKELNPKQWFYHCVYADQFIHTRCMLWTGADSNIMYGKSHMDGYTHKHKLTTISCTYDCTRCNICREPLRRNRCSGIGLECIPCNFRVHLYCPM